MRDHLMKLLDNKNYIFEECSYRSPEMPKPKQNQHNRNSQLKRSRSNFTKRVYLKKINSMNKLNSISNVNFEKKANLCTTFGNFLTTSPLKRKCQSVLKLLEFNIKPKISESSNTLWEIKSQIRQRNYSRNNRKLSSKEKSRNFKTLEKTFDFYNITNYKPQNTQINPITECNKILETKKTLENYLLRNYDNKSTKLENASFEEDSLDKQGNLNVMKKNRLMNIESNSNFPNTPNNEIKAKIEPERNVNIRVKKPYQSRPRKVKIVFDKSEENENENNNQLDKVPTKNKTKSKERFSSNIYRIIPDQLNDTI